MRWLDRFRKLAPEPSEPWPPPPTPEEALDEIEHAARAHRIGDVLVRELGQALADHPKRGAIAERLRRGETFLLDPRTPGVMVVRLGDAKRVHVDDGLVVATFSHQSIRQEAQV